MSHGESCPTFGIEYAQASDLGMRRMNNQDSLAVVVTADRETWTNRGHLLMVADGMGAHAAGELASKLAVDNVSHAYFKLRDLYPPAALRQAIRDANALIFSRGQSSIGFQGMGTTCTCLVLLPQGALVAHVGDSRVYRLRGHQLSQLTFDHSLVWEMAAAGHMAEEDVPAYIPKNVITRSLGPHESVNIDLEGPYDAAPGDVFLLCSDGLSGQVTDPELGALLHCLLPEDAAQTMVDLANLRGGPDNITLIVARVGGAGAVPSRTCASHATSAGASTTSRRWLQTISVAAMFVAAFCLVNEFWWAAAISAGVLAVAFGLLVTRRNGHVAACPPTQSLGGPYGNGPYRQISCAPDQKIVDSLSELATRMRSQLADRDFKIDWKPLDDAETEGRAAAGRGDHCDAIRSYSAGIRAIMAQLRRQRTMATDDSNIYRS